MNRARNTHPYPKDLDNPADYVRQPGEFEIPPGDEDAINAAARREVKEKGGKLKARQ